MCIRDRCVSLNSPNFNTCSEINATELWKLPTIFCWKTTIHTIIVRKHCHLTQHLIKKGYGTICHVIIIFPFLYFSIKKLVGRYISSFLFPRYWNNTGLIHRNTLYLFVASVIYDCCRRKFLTAQSWPLFVLSSRSSFILIPSFDVLIPFDDGPRKEDSGGEIFPVLSPDVFSHQRVQGETLAARAAAAAVFNITERGGGEQVQKRNFGFWTKVLQKKNYSFIHGSQSLSIGLP